MNISIQHLETFPIDIKVNILHSMIRSSYLWWYKDSLRDFNIQGRTNLYSLFSWSSSTRSRFVNLEYQERSRLLNESQEDGVRDILSQSTLSAWVESYLKQYPISRLVGNMRQHIPNLNELTIAIDDINS